MKAAMSSSSSPGGGSPPIDPIMHEPIEDPTRRIAVGTSTYDVETLTSMIADGGQARDPMTREPFSDETIRQIFIAARRHNLDIARDVDSVEEFARVVRQAETDARNRDAWTPASGIEDSIVNAWGAIRNRDAGSNITRLHRLYMALRSMDAARADSVRTRIMQQAQSTPFAQDVGYALRTSAQGAFGSPVDGLAAAIATNVFRHVVVGEGESGSPQLGLARMLGGMLGGGTIPGQIEFAFGVHQPRAEAEEHSVSSEDTNFVAEETDGEDEAKRDESEGARLWFVPDDDMTPMERDLWVLRRGGQAASGVRAEWYGFKHQPSPLVVMDIVKRGDHRELRTFLEEIRRLPPRNANRSEILRVALISSPEKVIAELLMDARDDHVEPRDLGDSFWELLLFRKFPSMCLPQRKNFYPPTTIEVMEMSTGETARWLTSALRSNMDPSTRTLYRRYQQLQRAR